MKRKTTAEQFASWWKEISRTPATTCGEVVVHIAVLQLEREFHAG